LKKAEMLYESGNNQSYSLIHPCLSVVILKSELLAPGTKFCGGTGSTVKVAPGRGQRDDRERTIDKRK
jgi:hypothetical protein